MTNEVRENTKGDVAIQSSNNFIKSDKRALNWYKNGTNKSFGLVCFSEYMFLLYL